MPKFTLRTINSKFFTRVELDDQPGADDALAAGLQAALMIAVDDIDTGATTAVVEVVVDDALGTPVRRSAVSISVAPLAVGPVEERAFPGVANDL